MVGSKFMILGSVLMRFSRFSQYLNRFNSDSNSWIVVGMRIWLSLQWHYSQLVLMTGSRLGFFEAHHESTPSQIWSKLLKISKELKFDIKSWKMLFCEDFDIVWPLVKPRVDKGHFGWKRHFERSETGCATPLYMFSWPHGEKMIFFRFFKVRHTNRGWTKYCINNCFA